MGAIRVAMTAVLAGLAALALATPAHAGDGLRFKRVAPDPLPAAGAFDLGVLQAPGAPIRAPLAPFTINHTSRSALVVDGKDATVPIGLSPLRQFPGYERLREPATPTAAGLYLHTDDQPARSGATLHLRAHGLEATGRVVFATRSVRPLEAPGVTWERALTADGLWSFRFTIAPGAELVFDLNNFDLPVFFRNSAQPSFIGPDAIRASSGSFTLELRDRHSYASADFDGNGTRDLFIAGGGYGGAITRYERWARDELLLARGGRFRPAPAPPKGACRGRWAAAPDANRDGLADVFVTCEHASPRLHVNRGGGDWRTRDLDVEGAEFRWLNVDRDRPVELLAFAGDAMTVYERASRREYSVPLRGAPSGTPAIGDLLGTGRPVIYVPSREGSTVVAGRRALNPARFGLPRRSAAAAIVDVNNDGRRDVHLAPQGLFRARVGARAGKPRFRRTGRLPVSARHVALTWADLEGDGRRDLLALTGKGPFAPRKSIVRFRNRSRAGKWLAVDSSRLMLGDRITVTAGGRRQVAWVGESEGSRWSDAHRRVSFGVGTARRARVRVDRGRGRRLKARTRVNRVLDPFVRKRP